MADDVNSYVRALQGLSPEDQAAMQPETFVNPAVKGFIDKTAKHVAVPGQMMQANPYPPGSEENAWFENQREQTGQNWANSQALNMIGTGVPAAVPGAVGVAGGRLAATRNPLTGRLQVSPQQLLTDKFIEGGPPVQATAPVAPLRVGGKFATPNVYYRNRVPSPEELTHPPTNEMYSQTNAPAPVQSNLQKPIVRGDPADVERWKNFLTLEALKQK